MPPASTEIASGGDRDDRRSSHPVTPRYRHVLGLGCERGVTFGPLHGCAALWMPFERRGDFSALVDRQRRLFQYDGPIGWRALSRRSEAFHRILLDEFFNRSWLMFHALIGHQSGPDSAEDHDSTDSIDSRGSATRDTLSRRTFHRLVQSRIEFMGRENRTRCFHLCVVPVPSRLHDENRARCADHLTREFRLPGDQSKVVVRDLDRAPAAQLADLFLHCLVTGWSDGRSNATQTLVARLLAQRLGWKDLRARTGPGEWKFQIATVPGLEAGLGRAVPVRRPGSPGGRGQ